MDMKDRIARSQALLAARRESRRGHPERSFLAISDLSREEVAAIIDAGLMVKKRPDAYAGALRGKSVGLLFQKTSTRTRCSFEIGVGEMGGQPLYIDWRTTNFGRADLQDEMRVLSRYVDLIMARVYKHEDLVLMKENSEVPVINGLCDRYHPCQGLTDFMTIKEYFGELEGIRLAYIGDGNNVCHSLINGAIQTGAQIAVAHPPGYEPRAEVVEAGQEAQTLSLMHSPEEAVKNADVIYTDTWISMGDEAEEEARKKAFATYTVDEDLLKKAPSHALVMHCLPAHRGYEISSGALDSENSVVVDQAENRKHAQKALMAWILEVM